MTTVTRRACVMGHAITHSRSPMLHGYWLRALGIAGAYELADIAPADFPGFFRNLRSRGYVGGNITKPHKQAAFELVDRREPAAEAIGAVNTVWYEHGTLVGGNTDWLGIVASLDAAHPGWDAGDRVVVLGAGGAARAAVYGFRQRNFTVAVVNRTLERARTLAAAFEAVTAHGFDQLTDLLGHADVLINTTSLGQAGEPLLAIDLAPLKRGAIVYDVIYVPLETDLVKAARARGHRTVDGLSMLLHQAVPGFAHWFGVTPQVTAEQRALLEADIRGR